MVQADLEYCLSDSSYILLSRREGKELGFGPHEVLAKRSRDHAVVLTVKSEVGEDFSCNAGVVPAGVAAIRDRVFREVYVGQVDPDNPGRLLAWDTVKNIQRKLNGVAPREGRFGDYFFLHVETFLPSGVGSNSNRMVASVTRAPYGFTHR